MFVKDPDAAAAPGPLQVVKCREESGRESCGLVQLRHSYDLQELYGRNYGYRSGLNNSMVRHLHAKVAKTVELARPGKGDLVVDIGSNDGTLLRGYPDALGVMRVGIDPTAAKFRKYYPPEVIVVPDFFSAEKVRAAAGGRKARIVTSIAMFYDLESPSAFMAEVASLLEPDGVWVFEQSYMPLMLERNSYDTVCHEHLEYYGLRQIAWMAARAGLKIVGLEFNDVNGGSFSVTAALKSSRLPEASEAVAAALEKERAAGLHTLAPYEAFKRRAFAHRDALRGRLREYKAGGKTVFGYGASTKGNVLLQFCGLGPADIPMIAEVNEDKFGCFTPGTRIPIVPEAEARARKPDFFLVLPWHFRDGIVEREREFRRAGGRLLFPLPVIEEVGA